MTMQTRALTAEEIETYRRDGVVCLGGILSDAWIAEVKAAVDDAEQRFSNEAQPEPAQQLSKLHALTQLGDMLDEMGAEVLRNGDVGSLDSATYPMVWPN